MKQCVLITGAAGFIGSSLAAYVLRKNPELSVIGIDNFSRFYDPAYKKRRIAQLKKSNRFAFHAISINELHELHTVIDTHKPTVLFHAAAEVGVRESQQRPLDYFETNVGGTIKTLLASSKTVKRAVVLSSSSVYGSIKTMPLKENMVLGTSTPVSVYGSSKLAMEMAVRSLYPSLGMSLTIARPFSVYGPGGRPDMLPMKILRAAINNEPLEIYGRHENERDWTYIDDVVKALWLLSDRARGFNIVNIGNGQPIILDEVIRVAEKTLLAYGRKLRTVDKERNKTEMLKTWADTKKLNAFHLTLSTSFNDGFEKTAAHLFSQVNRDE